MPFFVGQKVRASQLNLLNLLSTGQRASNNTSANVTATSFADPTATCSVSVTSIGTLAVVKISALMQSAAGPIIFRGAVNITGATTITAATNLTNGFVLQQDAVTPQMITAMDLVTISPGANTYSIQYLTVSGTAVLNIQSIMVLAP